MDKKELERRLDRLCSTITRCREPKCFTCGKRLRYAERQAGHFISRTVKYTRWDLANIHTQCALCNVGYGGNLPLYRSKLSQPTLKALEQLYERYKHGHLPEPTYEEKVQIYNRLLKLVRQSYPKQTQQFAEWQEIE